MTAERFWTLANTVSLSRVILAMAFAVIESVPWRLALVVTAAGTDAIDGWIARRRGGGSRWGALVDPVSDRAFAIIAVGALAWDGVLTPIQVFIVLFRDLATAIGLFVARRMPSLTGVTFVARLSGKIVTALQFAVMVAALMAPTVVAALVTSLGVVSFYAVVDYTRYLQRERVARRADAPPPETRTPR